MSISHWKSAHENGTPLTLLTAYDAQFAQFIDSCEIDGILVGDSLRHTFFGESSTVKVSMDHMIYHTQAVLNGAKNTLIISDMPFMSYSISIEESLKNATRLIQEGGAHAIKCEVRESHLPTIERFVKEGIQTMAHIGLQPQYINETGGYSLQGTSSKEQKKMISLAKSLSDIGVFAIVLEKIPISLSKTITENVTCPTIGIGAGPHCSGQVLVTNDLLGFTPNFKPKFIKQYLDGSVIIKQAISEFKTDVTNKTFPTNDHGYE
jgi:3-methyl-2-oxobutanoate hydroxymethyltransferase